MVGEEMEGVARVVAVRAVAAMEAAARVADLAEEAMAEGAPVGVLVVETEGVVMEVAAKVREGWGLVAAAGRAQVMVVAATAGVATAGVRVEVATEEEAGVGDQEMAVAMVADAE